MTTKIPVELSSTPGIVDGSNATAITIDSSENVGIGTTSPSYPFHVTGSGDTVAAVTAGASSIAALNLGNDTNKADGGIRYDNSADALIFRASNAERMRIDSSGNLLHGTTGTSWTNTAGTYLFYQSALNVTRDGAESMNLNRLTSDGDILTFRKAGSTVGSIGNSGANIIYYAGAGSGVKILNPSSGFDGLMPCSTTGADRDASMDLGSANTRFKDLYLSGGAFIGGTGDANKLDDYEEGTYTPSITPATSGSVEVSSYTKFGYTKVGRLVTVTGLIRSDTQSSPQGDARISLPFTVADLTSLGGRSFGTVKVSGLAWGSSGYLVAELIEGNSYFVITICGDGGSNTTLNANTFTSGVDTVSVGFSYFTT